VTDVQMTHSAWDRDSCFHSHSSFTTQIYYDYKARMSDGNEYIKKLLHFLLYFSIEQNLS